MSGSQRQRLAIARSIIKSPKFLILDEGTSAVDVRGEKFVQAALDKVSEARMTITIAHRLWTIKKSDKIVDMNGVYFALVGARQLSMEESFLEDVDSIKETIADILQLEHRKYCFCYSVLLLAPLQAALPLQCRPTILAQRVRVVTETEQQFTSSENHWSLMFFVLALGMGAAFYMLGISSNSISTHITCHYRQECFESVPAKRITFFYAEENSSGTLTSAVSCDPTQLQQLLGINMVLEMQAIFSRTGCIINAFVLGRRLTAVTVFMALPIILIGNFIRLRNELQLVDMNQAVFDESSKFAVESIGACRTVTLLTLEDVICKQYVSSFLVYTAIVNGSESAGTFLSFGLYVEAIDIAQASAATNRILSFRILNSRTYKVASELHNTEGGVEIELRDIENGQFAALVGASECGKVGIVSLLERFYDVQKGKILCNGTDITDTDVVENRKAQIKLSSSARNSLVPRHNQIDAAQKQRLSIARAVIRNPKILLLDEAVNSLNSESEKLVQAAFERAATGRTMRDVYYSTCRFQALDR
ncbi:P-loop containing nucleoside triphosphate hydrolase protein [Calycina marina]|uniref:P-loop containing nucleoside triphosphate hydrolase protein n=1 Tax=Calycina marina TaxID=1763456 RepID=A0A9P8CIQ7_9HELO|nr:P-loop containing nucleoside triphosphate hydrolase protein [Calycina marina]